MVWEEYTAISINGVGKPTSQDRITIWAFHKIFTKLKVMLHGTIRNDNL